MAEVSAIVAASGSGPVDRQSLERLRSQALLEILVVEPAGPYRQGRTRNAAIDEARGERLLFLDATVLGAGNWVETLCAAADQQHNAAVCAPLLLNADGMVANAGFVFSGTLEPVPLYAGLPGDHPAVRSPRTVQAAWGGCLLVDRAPFEAVGGFDDEFVDRFEDIDLCLRLRRAGWRTRVVPSVGVQHTTPWESYRWRRPGPDHDRYHAGSAHLAVPDDVATYAADGLVDARYDGSALVDLSIAPELGIARTLDTGTAVERALAARAHELFMLRDQRDQLQRDLWCSGRARWYVRSDGSRLELRTQSENGIVAADQGHLVGLLTSKIAPLRCRVSTRTPARVNILISELKLRHLFAGYAGVLQLAGRLAARGSRVRVVSLDHPNSDATELMPELAIMVGRDTIANLELEDGPVDRSLPLEISADDVFVAGSVWSAHVARHAVQSLGHERFIFLVQEDETLFYPSGSFSAMARAAYAMPHYALVSTEPLREWMEAHGRLADGTGPAGVPRHAVFRNAIIDPGTPSMAALRDRRTPRLVFYARPAATESRNLYELGYVALRRAVEEGIFDASWRFTGVAAAEPGALPLGRGRLLHLVGRENADQYRARLRQHDLGLSLMDSPHPSLPPIEMAAAGMPTVTSIRGAKTTEYLRTISPNLIGCVPTVDGILGGLRDAVSRTTDFEGRVAGGDVAWSRTAAEAFTDRTLDIVEAWIREIRRA